MISDEVVSYVRTALSQGATKDAVQSELGKAGWTPEQIAQIFEKASPTVAESPARLDSLTNTQSNQSIITTPTTMEPNTTPTMNTAGGPQKSSHMGIIIIIVLLLLVIAGGGAYLFLMPKGTVEDQGTDAQNTGNQNTSTGQDLVDERNAFDASIEKPVLSDGQRLGSVLHQFSAVVPKGWGVVATSSDGYLHFDVVSAQAGAAGGLIRISRYLTQYPETVTLKEIAEKERQDLKDRAEGFTEKEFKTATVAGREIYIIQASSVFNNADVEITAYLFLDKGRYYIVTGITAGEATVSDFASTLKTIVESFEITAV